MITLSDLLTRSRRLLQDEDARIYNDYQLEQAVHDALDYLSRTCVLLGSDLTITRTTLHGGDPLPDDLIALISITDQDHTPLTLADHASATDEYTYRIENNHLITDAIATITYHRTLPHPQDSTIDLPAPLTDTLAHLTALTIQHADDNTKQAIINPHRTLIARRHRTARHIYMPWKV